MTAQDRYLQSIRDKAWEFGIHHRETLLLELMDTHSPSTRPLLKDVVDDLIEVIQQARLREDVLPLSIFGQTERRRGRIEVTINSRTEDMPGVKDGSGVKYVTKWHESIHIPRDLDPISDPDPLEAEQGRFNLAGIEEVEDRLIVCRRSVSRKSDEWKSEIFAENAALAAAIATEDLERCESYHELLSLASRGGDVGQYAWILLYRTAESIGVNSTALVKYFRARGLLYVEREGRVNRLIAAKSLLQE